MVCVGGEIMNQLIKLYREHPSKFIEDNCNIKLSAWQKFVVNHIDDIQNLHMSYPRCRYFRTLRELEKYIGEEIKNEN